MPRPRFLFALVLSLLASSAAAAQAPRGVDPVVDAAWLSARLEDPTLVVLHVDRNGDYEGGHVPGARKLVYSRIVTRRGSVTSELPDATELRATFESLGVSDGSTVVVYAHEAPMATRVLLSLAAVGVERIAYLDGGLERWRAEGRPLSRTAVRPTPGSLTAKATAPVTVDAAWIETRLSRPGLALIDTRTSGEYVGSGNRSGMPSAGHLFDARQLEWEDLFSDGRVTLKPRAELARLFRERVADGDLVVTYCWVGYRASATWFVARLLGYDARLYDGSYQDWSQRGLPTRAGASP